MSNYPVIIVGHFLEKYESRRKYTDLTLKNNEKISPVYITPINEYSSWRTDFGLKKNLTKKEKVYKLNQYISKQHWLYLHSPIKIYKIISKIKPLSVIVENEPHSLITIEIFIIYLIWTFLNHKRKKFIIFSWDNLNRRDNPLRNIYKIFIDKFLLKRINLVICGNVKCKENFILRGVKEQNLAVHPQVGIDTKAIKKIYKTNTNSIDKIQIFYCGRIVYEKGIHILIKCHEKLLKNGYKVETIIAGNGSGKYYKKIKDLTSEMKSLQIIPALKKDEMYEKFAESYIFVLPSIETKEWAEQFGLTIAEAMANRDCLALGSNCGAIPEVLGHKELVFEQNSVNSLYEKIKYFLLNKEIKEKYALEQSKFSQDNYSFNSVANLYGNSLSKIIFN